MTLWYEVGLVLQFRPSCQIVSEIPRLIYIETDFVLRSLGDFLDFPSEIRLELTLDVCIKLVLTFGCEVRVELTIAVK